jgi:diaminopimelate epimerase
MRAFQFTKMQGLGNDFVVLEGPVDVSPEDVVALCDRRFGVGADGVLVVTRGDPVRMGYWNADGSAAEMCGNGLRCIARYAYDKGWAADRNFAVQTPIGIRGVRVLEDRVEAAMGRPSLDGATTIDGADYRLVDMGNPHAVSFVDDPARVDVVSLGRALQAHFPAGVNVEFVSVAADGEVTMRVFERGVGETLACGTGIAAVAAVVASDLAHDAVVTVNVPGGQARVEFRDGVAWLVGPADYSFRGSVGER